LSKFLHPRDENLVIRRQLAATDAAVATPNPSC
jgi:hypothetical protein